MSCPKCHKENTLHTATSGHNGSDPRNAVVTSCAICGNIADIRVAAYKEIKLGGTDIYN